MSRWLALALLAIIAGAGPAWAESWQRDRYCRGCDAVCGSRLIYPPFCPRLTGDGWPVCGGEIGGTFWTGINIREYGESYCRVWTPWGYEYLSRYYCRCWRPRW